MANYRRGRINDEVQKELSIVVREIKDPRVSGAMVCITGTEVTPDLKYAKVYYSVLGGDKKEVAKGLRAASGYIRRRIAQSLNLRVTPEFSFFLDESIEHGARIASILNTITFSDDEEDVGDSEGENDENEIS
ncbi:MAG: 30S ribosome-binding factor RbfA [Ruminococcaceae bacterium]|nr:30S ribosome-binding factor RbfA [Oscillospiraceae bacterium]